MKAQMPPSFWASAMMWLTSVVLPEDSGPKTSPMGPRGAPPIPSARSSASEPVGIEATLIVPLSPSRISEPSPNSLLIPVTALSRAASFAFASLAEASFKFTFLSAIRSPHCRPSGQLDLGQRGVARTLRLEFRTVESHAAAKPCLGQPRGDVFRRPLDPHRPPRSAPLRAHPGDGHMR